MASPLTVYANSVAATVQKYNSTYANVLAASNGSSVMAAAYLRFGQNYANPTYYGYESFIRFDTSGIPSAATITGATLSFWDAANSSAQAMTVNIYAAAFNEPIVVGDWRANTVVGAYTLVASRASSAWNGVAAYRDMTNEAAMLSAIVKGGVTQLVIASSRFIAGSAPSAAEYVVSHGASGANPPKLVVTYTEAAAVPIELLRTRILSQGVM